MSYGFVLKSMKLNLRNCTKVFFLPFDEETEAGGAAHLFPVENRLTNFPNGDLPFIWSELLWRVR
jgi:hypothetical protein